VKNSKSIVFLAFVIGLIFCQGCGHKGKSDSDMHENKSENGKITVAVFNGHGAAEGCVIDALEALKIDRDLIPVKISAAEIINNGLDQIDVLIFPGGGGSRQLSNLGDLGMKKVKEFVLEKGKGIVGICAGAYLLSDTPDYACMNLFPVKAIDIEHDNRGRGIVEFSLTKEGQQIFYELQENEKFHIYYYEGPLFVPSTDKVDSFHNLATLHSDVFLEGDAPAGVTPDKPLFLNGSAGKGKIFMSVAHPETTPGLRWMVPRMVRWVAGMDLKAYPSVWIKPWLCAKEILFNKELRDEETHLFKNLIYGDSTTKIFAINRLVEMHSWSARLWIPGLLRDGDAQVRLTAAKALSTIEYSHTIPDIKALIEAEENSENRRALELSLAELSGDNKN
jgi:glutamine amidotransferase-like uncharacterized protein